LVVSFAAGVRSTWVLTEFQSSIQVTTCSRYSQDTSVAADIFKVHADLGLSHPKLPQIQMFLSLSYFFIIIFTVRSEIVILGYNANLLALMLKWNLAAISLMLKNLVLSPVLIGR